MQSIIKDRLIPKSLAILAAINDAFTADDIKQTQKFNLPD